jgi:hypothetical protein
MTASTKEKRLATIEVHLNPKEWAIRLAHEMRSQPSDADFVRVVADEPYREWPWVKPFFKLSEQAEAHYPGNRSENISARNQSARRLRTEFHALKKLICKANEIVTSRTETMGLKTALKLSVLHSIILRDAFERTSNRVAGWVKEKNAANLNAEECQSVLLELASCTDVSFAETLSDGRPLDSLCIRLHSLIEIWVDEMAMLIMDVIAHQIAVQTIQEKYFDGHPILFRDVEAKLTKTSQTVHEAAAIFNEYLQCRAHVRADWALQGHHDSISSATSDHEPHLAVDIEAIQNRAEMVAGSLADTWVRDAKDKAVADILEETGEHHYLVWQRLREKAGLQLRKREG